MQLSNQFCYKQVGEEPSVQISLNIHFFHLSSIYYFLQIQQSFLPFQSSLFQCLTLIIMPIILILLLFLNPSPCLSSQNTLQISMLNFGEKITLSLNSYLDAPKLATIDLVHSKNIESLSTAIINQPIIEISSVEMTTVLPNGTVYAFKSEEVLQSISIFNQPNKIFLMRGNIILSVRYQFSPSDNTSAVSTTQLPAEVRCMEISTLEALGNYYVVAACAKNEVETVLFPFRFNYSAPGVINNLVPLDPVPVSINSTCLRLKMYSFRELSLKQKTFYNSILYYCAQNSKHEPSLLYFLSITNSSLGDSLVCSKLETYQLSARNLQSCLMDCSWATKYEDGILTQQNDSLNYFRFNKADGDSNCEEVMKLQNVSFVDAIEDQDIQYIYMIFNDRIIIKESYSPNFQTIMIRKTPNMTLQSYAIARKFLTLIFANTTHNFIIIYDLFKVYPSEVEHFTNKSLTTVYSVNNFLQSGNYYLSYDQQQNRISLNYYQGYLFTFSVKDPLAALPHVTINISDQQNQNLILECSLRSFNDTSITALGSGNFLKTYRDLLQVNLSDYIQGPLGKFHNYPNNISAFQYINAYSEINISAYIKLSGIPMALSFNNYLNAAIINFYYSSLTNTCQLSFDPASLAVSLTDCKALKRKKSLLESPNEIVVLSQDKYLQYNESIMEYCSLSANNEFECMRIIVPFIASYSRIKLVRYQYKKDSNEVIQLLLFNAQQITYCCFERNAYYGSSFNYTLHYYTDISSLPELVAWRIYEVFFDQGYHEFLVMRLVGLSGAHRVVIFDRPITARNSSGFIGHVIQTFDFSNLQAIFVISNLIVCVFPSETSWTIQEYKITKYYKVKETRRYPLYDYIIRMSGNHKQDGNFIYLQATQGIELFYLVYSPLRPSSGVLSHRFSKAQGYSLTFAQQIGDVSDNSMGINNDSLFGLVSPSLLFKFLTGSKQTLERDMGKYDLQVSVLDSTNKMSILTYQFDYNQGEEYIRYDGSTEVQVSFDQFTVYSEFVINPQRLQGPVNSYTLQLPDDSSCDFFIVESRDIFTKEGCLVYSNPTQYGALSDFLAITINSTDIELLVTDSSLLCVINRRVFRTLSKELKGLSSCRFQVSKQNILMACDNSTSGEVLIYNVTVTAGRDGCVVSIENIKPPKWLNYGSFKVKLSGEYVIFEVPIRYKQNCIYYKGLLSNSQVSQENNSLLVGVSMIQSQFQTIDTSISDHLFFILDNGVGIYNLSDWASEVKPALWLSQADIFKTSDNVLTYLKFLGLHEGIDLDILVELGTEQSSYEVMIRVWRGSGGEGQTVYSLLQVSILYEYKQYMSCKNTLQSKSQNYGSLIIKICNYSPADELVFANFVSITNQTTGALIQFYNRSGSSSYPFRIDTIYSNFLSHHSFLIRQDTLIVASLFNLLCYYALATTLTWQFHYINETTLIFDPEKVRNDKDCRGELIISNLQSQQRLSISITYDYDEVAEDYWTDGFYYIQRVAIILILANTLRLVYHRRRRSPHHRLRKRETGRQHTNRFEVMMKINSKKSG